MKHTTGWKTVRALALAAVLVGLFAEVVSAQTPPYVRLKNNQVLAGTGIRAKLDGTVILETEAGSRTFAKGQYIEAVAAQPAEIGQAMSKVKAKQFDEAVVLLEGVVKDYRYLSWDAQALKLLPQVYLRKGDGSAAVSAYEKYFKSTDLPDSDAQLGYVEALIQSKQFAKTEPVLDKMVAGADRATAAQAQVLRGDVKAAQNRLDDAVLDYLRTAILFKAERDVQAEALYKTGAALEKLRDPRAKDYYKKVVEGYGSSRYAAMAKERL